MASQLLQSALNLSGQGWLSAGSRQVRRRLNFSVLAAKIGLASLALVSLAIASSPATVRADGPQCTVVHFTSAGCEPCQQLIPAINQLRNSGVQVQTVDAYQDRQLAGQMQVTHLPTLVMISGQVEVDRIVGVASYAQIAQRVARVQARNGQSANGSSGSVIREPEAASSGPIIRGQSAGLGAFPLLSSSVSRVSQVSQQLSSGLNNLSQQSSQLQTPGTPRQSGTTLSPLTPQQAFERAAKATVRIQVDEKATTAYGTGTIIDMRGDEALILTCGHLFRDMQPNSQLTVDLFAGTPQETKVIADLLDFTTEGADVGLMTIRMPVRVEPVIILPKGEILQIGQSVFSYGCDHGAVPSRRETIVSNINRYLGAPNIEIQDSPVQGRSGGGLFDMRGRLIGVCNASTVGEVEGIYAAAEVIYSQLERFRLEHLFVQGASQPDNDPQLTLADNGQIQWPDESATASSAVTGAAIPTQNNARTQPVNASLTCILHDADGNQRLVQIDTPSEQLLKTIEQYAN
ncbi:MAG: trypsin-like peptidase domain-containing protein [Planctomycetales bacterium]|nr:trypsin-like peptidase domain-containing protein [Planctomycetales bacterium]